MLLGKGVCYGTIEEINLCCVTWTVPTKLICVIKMAIEQASE